MLLSKTGIDNILRRIMETGGMTESMEKFKQVELDVARLRADFDERAGILDRYGETYDGEDEEYDYREKSNISFLESDGIITDPSESVSWALRAGSALGGAGLGGDTPGGAAGLQGRVQTVDSEGRPTDGDTIIDSRDDWKSKYDELKKQYLDRFFGRDSAKAVEAQASDMYEDSEDMFRGTIDDLLYGAPDGEKDEGL